MRLKIFLGFLLLWPPLLTAQLTQVSGTIKDPSGLPYANGTITATLVISASPRFTFNSLPYTPPSQPVGLDSTGSFVMSLGDVNQLTPSGGTWSFHVCSAIGTVQPGSPITQGPVCFDVTGVVITGAAVNLTATLSAAAPPLTTSSGSVTVFPINCPPNTVCMTTPSALNVGLGFANLAGFQTAAVFGAGNTPIGQILAMQVNGSAVGSFPGTPAANFNATTPAAPTNGRNVQWQTAVGNPGTISAALVGDGSTNCLSGQGTYVACSGSGFPGSGTNPFVATSTLALPSGTPANPSVGFVSGVGFDFPGGTLIDYVASGAAQWEFSGSSKVFTNLPICDFSVGNTCLTWANGLISVTGSATAAFQTNELHVVSGPTTGVLRIGSDNNVFFQRTGGQNVNVNATLIMNGDISLPGGGSPARLVVGGDVAISGANPTIAAAGCGGAAATITTGSGTAAFLINVGTAPSPNCTITLPAANNAWICFASDISTTTATVFLQKQTTSTSTSATFTNFTSAAAPAAYVANDVLQVTCQGR